MAEVKLLRTSSQRALAARLRNSGEGTNPSVTSARQGPTVRHTQHP